MNAVDLLKQDHQVVEDLFKQVENTPPSKHAPLFIRIKGELDTHAHIEETIFYPFAKKEGKKDLVDIILEGIEEHVQIKMFLKGIAALSAKAERFEPKLKVLIEDTRHHVKEEEREMFPMVKDQISAAKLEKLGERMEAAKIKYQKSHGIKPAKRTAAPSTLEIVLDKANEVVTGIMNGSDGAKSKNSKKETTNGNRGQQIGNGRVKKGKASEGPSAWDKANAKMQARAEK